MESFATKYPFRFWMTGCLAVVMSALGTSRGAHAGERSALSQTSRYRVPETAARIEACARKRGLHVFARVDHGVPQRDAEQDESALIVFESSAGGTPVLMEGPESTPEVPLSVYVRSDGRGDTEVLFNSSDWGDLPANVMRDLTELPVVVADALR